VLKLPNEYDINELLNEIENAVFEEYPVPIEKWHKYILVKSIFEKRGKTERAKEIDWEITLISRDYKEWCLKNPNKPYPQLDKNSFSYFQKRFNQSNNSLNKARYAYAVWILGKTNLNYARESIRYFLEVGKLYQGENKYKNTTEFIAAALTAAYCFEMAIRLSLSLSFPEVKEVLKDVTKSIIMLNKKNDVGRGIHDFINLVANISEDLQGIKSLREDREIKKLIMKVFEITMNIAEKWYKGKNFHWQRSYLENACTLVKFLGDGDKANELRVKIAESFEEEGRNRESAIVRMYFLEEALSVYATLKGFANKIKELKAEISKNLQEAESEFKEISVKIPLPIDEIVSSHVSFLRNKKSEEILTLLITENAFIPQKKTVRQLTEQIAKENPVSFIMPTYIYGRYGTAKKLSELDEILEYKVKEQFNLESEIKEVIIAKIFEQLLTDALSIDEILEFLNKSKNVTQNSLKIIKEGIAQHVNGNFIASIHILVPQIEEMLRAILENHGIKPSKFDAEDAIMIEKTLTPLINETEQFIGEDFAEYLRVRLTIDYANIRNKVCHGWMESEQFTKTLSWTLIYIISRLSRC
jgi:hypothetical protein